MADIQQQAADKGEEVNIDEVEQVAMRLVLGERNDWFVGIGPSIPRGYLQLAEASDGGTSSSSSRSHRADPVVSELQATVQSQQASLQSQQAMMEQMQRQIMELTQNMRSSQPEPHPHPSPVTPQPRSTPPLASRDDQTMPASVEHQRERPSGSSDNSARRGRGGRGSFMMDKYYSQRK